MNDNNISAPNVIIADGDYIDRVAFELTVNFERMLQRRVPKADLAQWCECVALDGGVKEDASQSTTVVLIHKESSDGLKNFSPGLYATELSGQAFKGSLGEFAFVDAKASEGIVSSRQLLLDTIDAVCCQPDVRRLMVVLPEETAADATLRRLLSHHDSDSRRTTLFTMQPATGGNFRHVLLGYSLLAALGISSAEIDAKLGASQS